MVRTIRRRLVVLVAPLVGVLAVTAAAAHGQCRWETYSEGVVPAGSRIYNNAHPIYLNWVWNITTVSYKCAGAQIKEQPSNKWVFVGHWACTSTVPDASHTYSGNRQLRGLGVNREDVNKRLGAAVWW
jgi:hypothetical protein